MAQFGRPSTDALRDNWEEDDGTIVNIWDQIDEVVADDIDYIRTVLTPTLDVYVTKLTSIEDPIASTGHTVRIRRAKSAAGGDAITLTVELRQGYVNEGAQGTLIATIMNAVTIDETWTTTSYTLSGAEADAITNYADLFLRFVGNKP
jgi:hypothetical protein